MGSSRAVGVLIVPALALASCTSRSSFGRISPIAVTATNSVTSTVQATATAAPTGPAPSPQPVTISAGNVSGLRVLAVWPAEVFLDAAWIPRSSILAAVVWKDKSGTRPGVQFFDARALMETEFVAVKNARAAAAGSDGQALALALAPSGGVALIATGKPHEVSSFDDPYRCRGGDHIAYGADENTIVTAYASESGEPYVTTLSQWDPLGKECIGLFAELNGWALDLALSPNQDLLAVTMRMGGGGGTMVELWELVKQQRVCTHRGNEAAFDPNGKILAVYDREAGQILLLDVLTCEPVGLIQNAADAEEIAFAPDGAMIAAADGGIRIWDVGTQRILAEIAGLGERIEHVSFSPDGHFLLTVTTETAGLPAMISLWGVSSQQ